MKIIHYISVFVLMLISLLSCEDFNPPVANEFQGTTSTRIWGEARHSAFASLIKHNDYFYSAFREGVSHVGDGGVIRVIRSKNGEDWETVQVFSIDTSGGVSEDLSFNGTNQNMYIEHHTDFDYTSEKSFTATAYVNVGATTSGRLIIGNRNGGDGFEVGHNNVQLYVDLGNPYLRYYQSPNLFTPNTWHHFAYVFDGPNKSVALYQNGKLTNTAPYPSGQKVNGQSSTYGNQLVLFSKAPNHKTNPVGYSGYTKGQITFLRFWNKALSPEEIVTDKVAQVTETTPNLIAGYDFSVRKDVDGTYVIPDIKGKHPGILRNFTADDFNPPTDVRDPKLLVTSDNRIVLIVDGEFYRSGSVISRRPYVAISDPNGENFSALERSDVHYPTNNGLSETNFWIWSPVIHNGTIYGVDYIGGKLVLFTSEDDGKTFRTLQALDRNAIGNSPSEVALSFDNNDKMYAFVRRNGPGNSLETSKGYLGTSLPPYTDWSYKELDYRVEGQDVLFFNNDSFIVGTRRFDENNSDPHMAVYITDLEGNIKKEFILPSAGDCSYPGMVLEDDYLYVTYYASHEGVSSIYFSKIPVTDLQ